MTQQLIEFSSRYTAEEALQPAYTDDELVAFQALILATHHRVLGYQPIVDNFPATLKAIQDIAARNARQDDIVILGPFVSRVGIDQCHLAAYAVTN